jgi:hypothetical protein
MGYPIDLDGVPTEGLRREIQRRERSLKANECWYCHGSVHRHNCLLAEHVNEEYEGLTGRRLEKRDV